MTEPGSVLAGLQSLKIASDLIKGLRGVDLSLEKADLKIRLADLAEQLVNARSAMIDAQQEILNLHAHVRELEQARDAKAQLKFKDNVYFLDGSGGDVGPYCPRCYDADGRMIHLAELPPAFRDMVRYSCANCKGTF